MKHVVRLKRLGVLIWDCSFSILFPTKTKDESHLLYVDVFCLMFFHSETKLDLFNHTSSNKKGQQGDF